MRIALPSSLAVLVTLSLGLEAGVAGSAADPSASGAALESVRDAPVDPVTGIYLSDADPNGSVSVSATGQGRVLVIAGPRWEAQGWYRDDVFVGVWRRPGLEAQPAADHEYGWLRFRRASDSLIVAQFADSTGASRLERWTLVRHFLPGAVVSAHSGTMAGDSLPRFGESVVVEEFPRAVTTVPPVYPKKARKDGIEGTVVVQALVGRDGRVHDTRIAKSIPALDEAAAAAVRQWVFRPAQSQGQPVAVWVAVPVKFTLE
jgi:TonB family protein